MFQNTLSYSGQNLRDALRAFVMSTGATFGARSGVRPGDPGLAVSLAGSTINVSPGTGIFTQHGVYIGVLTSTWSGTLNAAHATLDRIDLVYLRIWDTDFDATGLRKTDVVYLAGTASSTPVAPTPGGTEIYLPLATITVPHSGGGSPSVSTAVLPYTVAPGGILPLQSSAPSSPYVGQYYDDNTNLRRWNGSSWDTFQKVPGASTPWTPIWSTSTGSHSPSFGNATIDCRYYKLGRLVTFWMNIVFGSTTNFGSGATTSDNWQFTLPVTSAMVNYPVANVMFEPGTSRGVAGNAITTGDGLNIQLQVGSGAVNGTALNSGVVDSLSPWTWAATNKFHLVGQYEATS